MWQGLSVFWAPGIWQWVPVLAQDAVFARHLEGSISVLVELDPDAGGVSNPGLLAFVGAEFLLCDLVALVGQV